jgi:hypothetical protein
MSSDPGDQKEYGVKFLNEGGYRVLIWHIMFKVLWVIDTSYLKA